jgi:AraC-like DNA-binding protein
MFGAYKSLRINWLIDPDVGDALHEPEMQAIHRITAPLPAELGQGSSYAFPLELGMGLFRIGYQFNEPRTSALIPVGEVQLEFSEPTFMVEALSEGRAIQHSHYPVGEFLGQPGVDVFRLTDRVALQRVVDTSTDVQGTGLVIGTSVLKSMLGASLAEQLLESLDLLSAPKARAHTVAPHVASHLHKAIPENLTADPRKLFAQARVLDYLDALSLALNQRTNEKTGSRAYQSRAHALHEHLIQIEGKTPTLVELSKKFACSAKRLNADFSAVYGVSIYSFISDHRLAQAHQAVLESDVPLKQLAQRLGYAHFNHFGAAFKKKFGYSPGSLRKPQ